MKIVEKIGWKHKFASYAKLLKKKKNYGKLEKQPELIKNTQKYFIARVK